MAQPIVLMLVLTTLLSSALSETVYITPEPGNTMCPDNSQCTTLSQYASMTNTANENVTLVFLPGQHNVSEPLRLEGSVIELVPSDSNETSRIVCNGTTGIIFENMQRVRIANLPFTHCVLRIALVDEFVVEDSFFYGQGVSGSALEIEEVTYSRISSCLFTSSVKAGRNGQSAPDELRLVGCFAINPFLDQYGGAMIICSSRVYIDNSRFEDNNALTGGAMYVASSSVEINSTTFNRNVAVRNETEEHFIEESSGGAIYLVDSEVTIHDSVFSNNSATSNGGAIFSDGLLRITNSFISYNRADVDGGALYNFHGTLIVSDNNVFTSNNAVGTGGAIFSYLHLTIENGNLFDHNFATIDGGALFNYGDLTLRNSNQFFNNSVGGNGGALFNNGYSIITEGNVFSGNSARDGGAIYNAELHLRVTANNVFSNNIALIDGGAIWAQYSTIFLTDNGTFTENIANRDGGVLWVRNSILAIQNGNMFYNNTASLDGGVIWCQDCNLDIEVRNAFASNTAMNGGVLLAEFSNVTVTEHNVFDSNQALSNGGAIAARYNVIDSDNVRVNLSNGNSFINNSAMNGGAVWIRSINVTLKTIEFFNNSAADYGGALAVYYGIVSCIGEHTFSSNNATYGAAIFVYKSQVENFSDVSITNNFARSSGSVYLSNSQVLISGALLIVGNTANKNGGGIYSRDSSISVLSGFVKLERNSAVYGGGVYLEQHSQLLITKKISSTVDSEELQLASFQFIDNSADFGGAIFVDDYSNPSSCTESASQCFFQILFQGQFTPALNDFSGLNSFLFSNNSAARGPSVYGGLLDRCMLNSPPVYSQLNTVPKPIDFLTQASNLDENQTKMEIESQAVRVCFCRDGSPDCNYQPPRRYLKVGQMLKLSIVAVGQVNNTLPGLVHSSLLSEGDLTATLLSRNTSTSCTPLELNIISQHTTETLVLYAEGPCNSQGISQQRIELEFQSCMDVCSQYIGFQEAPHSNLTACQCECHSDLSYVTNCDISSGKVERSGDYWIGFTNESEIINYTFISVKHCPYDYCLPSAIFIDLNAPNGSDSQCAFNRSGIACGSCKPGQSLVFGSSSCADCSNVYLVLIIPFAIAGVALVVFLLVCNLTVAVGTINGLIFYANIVVANRALFFPFGVTSLLTVFISWLSLSLGIETCFYHGMDGFEKILLQFLFDAYLISLAVAIIILSNYSQRFSNLIANKNPVATLATLVLITYEKSIRKLFSLLAFAIVRYSDGSERIVWLFDPNVPYLGGKHIVLFILFVLIFIIGLLFILLIMFGHCLTRLPNKRLFKYLHHPKFMSFLDAYQAPFKPRHRYWFGFLLLVREILYLFLENNAAGENRTDLLVIISVGLGVLSFKLFFGRVYKRATKDILESTFIINLIMFAVATFYGRETGKSQTDIAYVSFSFVFITFVGILLYHTYKYVLKNTKVRKYIDYNIIQKLKEKFLRNKDTNDRHDSYDLSERRDFSVSETSVPLQGPLNLLSRNPSDEEYMQAQHPMHQLAPVSLGVVEISPASTPPMSRMLGHDVDNVLVDPDSLVHSNKDSSVEGNNEMTLATVNIVLSSSETVN